MYFPFLSDGASINTSTILSLYFWLFKRAYLFTYEDLGTLVFEERNDALKKVNKAEENKKDVSDEIYYEEY